MKILENELIKINKPLEGFQVKFTKDKIILNLIYTGTGKKDTCSQIQYGREKTDTIETIFDELRELVVREYLTTHWD